MLSLEKLELRCSLRQARKSLNTAEQHSAAQALKERFCKTSLFQRSTSLAAYSVFDGEIDPYPIVSEAWRLGKSCYLPVIQCNDKGEFMAFYPWYEDDALMVNRFGIFEPMIKNESKLVLAQEVELIIIPMVGFDLRGNRLGMGGGFYDKALANNASSLECYPIRVAVAHDFQKINHLPVNATDQPVHMVVTDKAIYKM